MEPPTDAEVLAVLDELAVEFAKGVGRMFLRKGVETLLTEVEPLVGIVSFDLEFNRLCLLVRSFDILLLPNLSRHKILFSIFAKSYEIGGFGFAKAFTSLRLVFLSHLVKFIS